MFLLIDLTLFVNNAFTTMNNISYFSIIGSISTALTISIILYGCFDAIKAFNINHTFESFQNNCVLLSKNFMSLIESIKSKKQFLSTMWDAVCEISDWFRKLLSCVGVIG